MLIVCPYTEKDAALAVRLWNWIGELGGCHKHRVLFVTDRVTNPTTIRRVNDAAKPHVAGLETLQIDPCHLGTKWPFGPNWAFLKASARVKEAYKEPFLWLETDCVPLKAGWMETLEEEYAQAGKLYMGRFVKSKPPLPEVGMWGIAIYPPDVVDAFVAHCSRKMNVGFDVALAKHSVPRAHNTRLFQFAHGPKGSPIKIASLDGVASDAVLFHQDKYGDVIRMLRSRIFQPKLVEHPAIPHWEMPHVGSDVTGYHCGDRGDVIYALPLLRELGISRLYLCPAEYTRERMTPEAAASLASLIEKQPYIEFVKYAPEPPQGSRDLNSFRRLLGPPMDGRYFYHTLSGMQLRWCGLPEWYENDQWLWVTPLKLKNTVVIARSPRYQDQKFDWPAVMKEYGNQAVFIGSEHEHREFSSLYGQIEHYKTETLLDVAQVIAGSDLFIGNQSCPYAIAEGLKHPAILEWTTGPSQNCHFSRQGLYYGTDYIKTPKLVKKRRVNWVALSDLHSGFGRMAHSFYVRTKQLDLNWVPTRYSEEFCRFDPAISLNHKRESCDSVVLDSVPVIHEFIKEGDIAFTMWESSRLPKTATDALNKCKGVIVPSEWCKQVYSDSGVKSPIYKVPLGTDSRLYRQPKARPQKPFMTFGASSRFCGDGNPRKNVDETISGFKRAFEGVEDVRLVIKGYDAKGMYDTGDERIQVISEFWTEHDMVRWYQTLDCFINLPRGSGWELHVHEAMLCGAVPIVLNHSSTLEFVDPSCGYLVDYELVDATWHVYNGCGQWALPVQDSYISTLRHVYNHRDEVESKREKARRATEHLTWENAATVMERTLLNLI